MIHRVIFLRNDIMGSGGGGEVEEARVYPKRGVLDGKKRVWR